MSKLTSTPHARKRLVRVALVAVALAAGLIGFSEFARPSGSVCLAREDCVTPPPDPNKAGWTKGTTVYYDVSGLPDSVRQQAKDAFAAWTDANKTNGSGVTFAPSDASHPASFTVGVGAADGRPGKTNTSTDANKISTGATTTLDLNNTDFFDSSAEGFGTAILKIMLHEIGHTMGITDTPGDDTKPCGGQTPGGSVMNGQCGVNDRGGNGATKVTTCDSTVIGEKAQYTRPIMQPGGGGSDYSGYYYDPGYGCTPYYWVYYESWDGGKTWEVVDMEYAGCW
ncbi:MAG: hypothetical protein JOZ02_09380 [Acidobacteria bacterium]|nr:hypothetical protein [Acidobacteriota bacterium]